MSDFIEIEGGAPLRGEVRVGGAKNGALPLLIAALLSPEKVSFSNVPRLDDITILLQLLEHFGGETTRDGSNVTIAVPVLRATEASYSLVKALRASFWVLAPLLARGRAARVALPGGDIIGARPVDIHLEALTKMGAEIVVKHGVVLATAPHGLKPAEITFRFPSVGATHQILMAAALTPGQTVVHGAAREPEIVALAEMINTLGGSVEGAGSATIVIQGREQLGGGSVHLLGDRIEAATYILAAAATRGDVRVCGFNPDHLGDALDIFSSMGITLDRGGDCVTVRASSPIRAVDLTTGPFPKFATDIQAPLMAALCIAEGESRIEETMFEGRFGHVSELSRMGARIQIADRTAIITGVSKLEGAPVEAFDIRAAAALVLAALAAEGKTRIYEPQHLRRGYELMDRKLGALGARMGFKVADPEDYMFTGC